jgi:hypothetical protein
VPAEATDTERNGDRIELYSAILLGVAATLTAVSAFFSSAAGGEELAAFNDSTSKLTDANFFYQQGNQTMAEDSQLFLALLEAEQTGIETQFITDLMSEELEASIEDWNTNDEVFTPFDSERYVVSAFAEADGLQAQSEAALEEAEEAGSRGDKLDLSTVIFAAALFVGGIISGFRKSSLQLAMLGVGAVLTVLGTAVMLSGL